MVRNCKCILWLIPDLFEVSNLSVVDIVLHWLRGYCVIGRHFTSKQFDAHKLNSDTIWFLYFDPFSISCVICTFCTTLTKALYCFLCSSGFVKVNYNVHLIPKNHVMLAINMFGGCKFFKHDFYWKKNKN